MNIKQNKERLLDYLANDELSFGLELMCIKSRNGIRGHNVGDIVSVVSVESSKRFFVKHKILWGEKVEGCMKWVYGDHINDFKIIGHPVMIGCILNKIHLNKYILAEPLHESVKLIELFAKCGFTKSLNDIWESESEIEYKIITSISPGGNYPIEQFKNKDVQVLYEFLWKLFESEINKKES